MTNGYKLCPKCGQPVLKKGQTRQHLGDYRHARGCPNDDGYSPIGHHAVSGDTLTVIVRLP